MDKDTVNNLEPNSWNGRTPDPKGLVLALELMELGIELAQQRILRQNPTISRADLIDKTNEWIRAPRNGSH